MREIRMSDHMGKQPWNGQKIMKIEVVHHEECGCGYTICDITKNR